MTDTSATNEALRHLWWAHQVTATVHVCLRPSNATVAKLFGASDAGNNIRRSDVSIRKMLLRSFQWGDGASKCEWCLWPPDVVGGMELSLSWVLRLRGRREDDQLSAAKVQQSGIVGHFKQFRENLFILSVFVHWSLNFETKDNAFLIRWTRNDREGGREKERKLNDDFHIKTVAKFLLLRGDILCSVCIRHGRVSGGFCYEIGGMHNVALKGN